MIVLPVERSTSRCSELALCFRRCEAGASKSRPAEVLLWRARGKTMGQMTRGLAATGAFIPEGRARAGGRRAQGGLQGSG